MTLANYDLCLRYTEPSHLRRSFRLRDRMGALKRKARHDGRGIFDERLDTLIVSPSSRQVQGTDERKTIRTAAAAVIS
jgi:hypothetical protein